MRIAYFTDTYHPQVNGLVTSIDSNREELKKSGNEILVFAPQLRGAEPEENVHRLAGITYFPQPEYTWVFPWGYGFNLWDFKKFKVDLVHSHASFGAGLVALAIAWWHKLPLVMTYHTLWADYAHYVPLPGVFVRWVNKHYSRWMCDRCALVIAPSTAIKQVLEGYGSKTRIEVLPSGLTRDVFVKTGAKKADFGCPDSALLFSCAGRTGREKRMDQLLKALAQASPRIPDWRLAIAGDGPERGVLEALAAQLGIREKVSFLGYVSRTKALDLMEASDLFIFPSVTETQGMVIIEAMGRGTPVIGADAMGVGIVLKDQKGGWLVKPDDIPDLAAKIQLAVEDKAAYAQKKAEAPALASTYAAEAINKKLADFYAEIVRAKG